MLYRSSDHIATFYSGLRTDLYLWSKNPKSLVSALACLQFNCNIYIYNLNLHHAFRSRKYKMIKHACLSDYVAHIYSVLDIDFIYLFTYFYMSATTNICGNFFLRIYQSDQQEEDKLVQSYNKVFTNKEKKDNDSFNKKNTQYL